MSKAGGKLENFYFAFGDDDVYTVIDVPDHATAAAIALTVTPSGALRVSTTVLLTLEEVDSTVRKNIDYRPPGA